MGSVLRRACQFPCSVVPSSAQHRDVLPGRTSPSCASHPPVLGHSNPKKMGAPTGRKSLRSNRVEPSEKKKLRVLPTLTPENSDIVSDISSGSIRSMNILTLLLADILSGIHSNDLSDILAFARLRPSPGWGKTKSWLVGSTPKKKSELGLIMVVQIISSENRKGFKLPTRDQFISPQWMAIGGWKGKVSGSELDKESSVASPIKTCSKPHLALEGCRWNQMCHRCSRHCWSVKPASYFCTCALVKQSKPCIYVQTIKSIKYVYQCAYIYNITIVIYIYTYTIIYIHTIIYITWYHKVFVGSLCNTVATPSPSQTNRSLQCYIHPGVLCLPKLANHLKCPTKIPECSTTPSVPHVPPSHSLSNSPQVLNFPFMPSFNIIKSKGPTIAPVLSKKLIWGWVKTLVPSEPQVIAGIYGCSSH